MAKLTVFNHLTVDGYFARQNGEIDWFRAIGKDDEYDAFTHSQSRAGSTLIFGRATYDMMRGFWPTPDAIRLDPQMASAVNDSPKLVFSRTLQSVEETENWHNITLMHEIEPEAIAKLKADRDMTILGSGSIVQQLTRLGLIDEYCFVLVPIVLGAGKSFFKDVQQTDLELIEARSFENGLVVLRYQPRKQSSDPEPRRL